jgi:molybdopterin-guanine dinucleotide biosynthesis protein A
MTMDAGAASPLGGVILAGGQSRRMGRPKALLRLAPDGPTLIEQVLARLRDVADEIIVITNTPDLFAHLGARMEGDRFPGLGSLAGIHAGLEASRFEHNLIVACDMPFLEPTLLRALAARPRDYDVLVPRLADGLLETLHAIYSRACLPAITAQLARGDAKIARFYERVRVQYVDEPELRRYDPHLRSAANLNTPDEFRAAGGMLPE